MIPPFGSSTPKASFTVRGKVLQTFFNIMDYGAKGDGVTDDTAAIQAAITACAAAGGGIVYFPIAASAYLISSTLSVASNNIWLMGASWGAQLIAASGFGTNPMILATAPGGGGVFRYGFKVSDLMLNGNNQSGVGGIELDSTYGALIDHARIYFCPGTGILLTDPSHGGARGAYNTIRDTWLTNGGAGTAIETYFSEDNTIDGGFIAWYNSTNGVGIKLQDGGNTICNMQFDECNTSIWSYFAHANSIVNNSFGRAVTTHINLEGAQNSLIFGNYFDECVGSPSPATIINCNNSQNKNNVITNNTCIGSGNGWTYFYYEAGGTGGPGNIVNDNQLAGLTNVFVTGSAATTPSYRTSTITVAASNSKDTTDADFTCTGINDQTIIQDAINALPSGGGKVTLMEGSYAINGIINIPNSYTTIEGQGWGTQLNVANGVNANVIAFDPPSNTIMQGCILRNFQINANGANQTAGDAIYGKGAIWCRFENININIPYGNGIQLYTDNLGDYGHHNVIVGCLIQNGNESAGPGRALYLNQSDENVVAHNIFQDNGNTSTTEPCHILDGAGLNTYLANSFVTGAIAISWKVGTFIKILNNTFDGCAGIPQYASEYVQVHVGSNGGLVQGNTFYNIGYGGTTNNSVGLLLDNCSDIIVMGNQFVPFDNTANCKAGVDMATFAPSNCTVIDNDFSTINAGTGSFATAAITTGGTGNVVKNNKGFNPQGIASISVGASPFTYTAGLTSETVYISSGTVSAVSKSSTNIFTATNCSVNLEPNESVVVTYSAAPTMIKDRH